jgi:hypothetical protein
MSKAELKKQQLRRQSINAISFVFVTWMQLNEQVLGSCLEFASVCAVHADVEANRKIC